MDYPPYADGDGEVTPYGTESFSPNRVGPFPPAESPARPNDNLTPYGTQEGMNEDHQMSYTDGVPAFTCDNDRTTDNAVGGRGPMGDSCSPSEAGLGVDGESPWKGSPVFSHAPENRAKPLP